MKEDNFLVLSEKSYMKVPNFLLPHSIHNGGNYIISLSELCQWLAQQAEALEVDVLPGVAGDELIVNEDGSVGGVTSGDMGVGKDGEASESFAAGIRIKAKQTVLTEGARGSLSEQVKRLFKLDRDAVSKQHYGLGLKEVWQVDNELFQEGLVQHTVNWPTPSDVYQGTFMYHQGAGRIHVGMVVGLAYANPYLNPYEEFQRWKTHPHIRRYFQGGECLQYGARVLNEGGFHAIPRLSFPGGLLAGCSAGFLDVAKIKGSHNAMKTGMLAAETIFE